MNGGRYSGIYRPTGYMDIINEYMDIEDNETRHVCLAINEEDQNQLLAALTSKLYDSIVDKVDDIDFGDIPKTKGDISKLPNYDKITECITTLRGILVQYKQKTDCVDTIDLAVHNLLTRSDLFEKAYRYNIELPIVVYNTIALSIISAISLLISTTIEFIKSPNQDSYQVSFDYTSLAKTKDHLLFTNLENFNKSCSKGDIDTSLNMIIKNGVKNFTGLEIGVVAGSLALITLILNIVPIMRELIFFFYYSRTRVADYFDIQADLLQMNAHNLELSKNDMDQKSKQRIVTRQMRIVDAFRKFANLIKVDCKKAEVSATKDIVSNNKKIKTNELLDSMPDSAAATTADSSLF